MKNIEIAAVPNQEFAVQLDDRFYVFALREANGVMAVSITRDGTPLISGARMLAGTPLLPYRYQEAGNFVVLTDDEALPYWDQFGVTQFLVYVTAAEIAALRGA